MIQQKHFTSKPLTNSVKFHKLSIQQNNINPDLSKSSLTHVASQTHFKRSSNSPIKNIVNGLQQKKNTSFGSVQNQFLLTRDKNNLKRSSKDFILHELNDSYSIGGHSKNTLQTDQYYKYWKSKAHQYLDQNFKLREENKKIKQENQQLRNTKNKQVIKFIEKQKSSQKIQHTKAQIEKIENNESSFSHLQRLFQDKMRELQKDLASKNIIIAQLQNKVMELNKKILGEQQRVKLQNRLGEQIETLTNENIILKNEIFSLQGYKQLNKGCKQPNNQYKQPNKNYESAKHQQIRTQKTYKDVKKKYYQNFKLN